MSEWMTRSLLRRLPLAVMMAAGFGAVIFALNSFSPLQNVWVGWATMPHIDTHFCEHTDMSRPVRQPFNTFSNIIYLIIAMYFFRRGMKDIRQRNRFNLISANPYYSIAYGVILCFVFCSSTMFHSSLAERFSDIDYTAVYSLALFPMMYFSHRLFLTLRGIPTNLPHPRERVFFIAGALILFVLLAFVIPKEFASRITLGLIITMIVFGFILEIVSAGRTNKLHLTTCMLTVSLGVMFFIFDNEKILCNPNSILQPHSVWHFFTGVSAFYFYLYIRSEKSYLQQLSLDEPLGEVVLHNRQIWLDEWVNKELKKS